MSVLFTLPKGAVFSVIYSSFRKANYKEIRANDVGRDSSDGIATRYGLDGPGGESRWGGAIFRTCPYRPSGPTRLLYNGYRVSFPEVKRPGRGVDHPSLSRADVKERVELYLYSPRGISQPILG